MKFFIPLLLLLFPFFGYMVGDIGGLLLGFVGDFFLILMSIRIVPPNTIRTVEFLGKFNRVLRQGYHFIVPILETTRTQFLYRRNFTVNVEGVTSDNVKTSVGLNVISFVEDDGEDTAQGNVYKSLYSIDDPITMMKAVIDEQLRAMIVQFTHTEIFGKREEIGVEIEEKLRVRLDGFGYKLDSIQVRDVNLDQSVMAAMNRVVESLRLRESAYNQAEADKITLVKAAEADKEAKALIGQGMALQREAIAAGFSESIQKIKDSDPTLTGKVILDFLLDSSRIETLEKIGKDNAKVIYVNDNIEAKKASLTSGQEK